MFKNKLAKYLLYAIGEILLIAIGILIAFYVNKWNENRTTILKAKEYLYGIYVDLQTDTTNFNHTTKGFQAFLDFKKWSLEQTDFNEVPLEWVEKIIWVSKLNDKINNRMFSKMQNSEFIGISEYQALFDSINNYYVGQQKLLDSTNEWDEEASNFEGKFWEYQSNFEISLPNDSIPIRQSDEVRKTQLINAITSIEGRNYLKIDLFRKEHVIEVYKDISKEATKLIHIIKKEMNFE